MRLCIGELGLCVQELYHLTVQLHLCTSFYASRITIYGQVCFLIAIHVQLTWPPFISSPILNHSSYFHSCYSKTSKFNLSSVISYYTRKVWRWKSLVNLLFLNIWRIIRSAKRLLIVSTNLDGISLAKFAKLPATQQLLCFTTR